MNSIAAKPISFCWFSINNLRNKCIFEVYKLVCIKMLDKQFLDKDRLWKPSSTSRNANLTACTLTFNGDEAFCAGSEFKSCARFAGENYGGAGTKPERLYITRWRRTAPAGSMPPRICNIYIYVLLCARADINNKIAQYPGEKFFPVQPSKVALILLCLCRFSPVTKW